jgi:hypothetical protein
MNNTQQQASSTLSLPNNASFKQSLYIAALDRFYGIRGLLSPVSETIDGVHYDFDFYHPESEMLIKFFSKFDEEAFRKYSAYAETHEVRIIIDAEEVEIATHPGCGHKCIHALPEELTVEAMLSDASLYFNDHIWELFDHEDNDGLSIWVPLLPIEIEMLDDEE